LVSLSWESGSYALRGDESGAFDFSVEGSGTATLQAMARGYHRSASIDVPVVEGEETAEVIIRLKRQDKVTARLLSNGIPVARAVVASSGFEIPGIFESDSDGKVEIQLADGGVTTLFVSGPGCSLTHFDVLLPDDDDVVDLNCASASSNISLNFVDADDHPVQNIGVTLFQGGKMVPDWFLQAHLQRLGLSPLTDGLGRLALVGMQPGSYDLFLQGVISPGGHVMSIVLEPSARNEFTVVTKSAAN
jgi:hypothetical protein